MAKKKLSVYDSVDTHIDHNTGEVVSTTKRTVTRRESTPEFTMVFVHGLSRLTKADLTKTQAKVLFELLKYTLNNSNMLLINKPVKKLISEGTGATLRTVQACVQALVEKSVIVKEKTSYFLNPIIFGRGNFQNVKKLTQALSLEYDFENETVLENQTMRVLYNEEQNMDKLRIVETKETVENNITDQEIIVEAVEQEHPNQGILDFKQNDIELELIKEKNKQLELENKQMELKLEMKREGLL